MVGESYHPLRSGWSYGAYLSSIATLVEHFGFEPPPGPNGAQGEEQRSRSADPARRHRDRDLGGP
jgi:hypothetical protein